MSNEGKAERHSEIMRRLDRIEGTLNQLLLVLQHPERSAFGPGGGGGAQPNIQVQRYNPQPFPYAGPQPSKGM